MSARAWTVMVLMLCGATAACRTIQRPQAPIAIAPAVDPSPFDDTPSSFVVAGPRFAPGETAIVRICVSPDGAIASADLIGSSGDKRFDDFALVWARQVRLASRSQSTVTQADAAKQNCGAVRVEIRGVTLPQGLSGADTSLG